MDFKKLYDQASGDLKLNFLDAIIHENQELQTVFLKFAEVEDDTKSPGIDYGRFIEIVNQTAEIYHDNLEFVDPDNPDWESYTAPHDGYIPDYEAAQYAAEQEFREVYKNFEAEAIDKIIGQQIDELTAMIIGLYEAGKDVEVNDEYDTFPELDEFLREEHQIVFRKIIEKLGLAAISDRAVINSIRLFFNYCSEKYVGSTYFLNYFEDYLIKLAGKSKKPAEIMAQLNQSKIAQSDMPRLVMLLNKLMGNKEEWLSTARKNYQKDDEVAGDLLQYHFENDRHEFLCLAAELFEKDRRYWALQLKEKMSHELDLNLFVEVFYQLVIDRKSMDDYLQLRPHLSPGRTEKLLAAIDSDKPFLVQILAAEERYEEIKSIVENNPNDWHYTQLIEPILEIYPKFCFNHIKYKAQKTLTNERGRSTYQRIVKWLQLADTIPGYKAETRLLARELYNHKPNLPALRDELKKGRLV